MGDQQEGRAAAGPGPVGGRTDELLAQPRLSKFEVGIGRRPGVVEALLALSNTIIIIRRLTRQARTTHRWDARPARRP